MSGTGDPGAAAVSLGLPHPYMGDAVPARVIPLHLDSWHSGSYPGERLHADTAPLAEIDRGLDSPAACAM